MVFVSFKLRVFVGIQEHLSSCQCGCSESFASARGTTKAFEVPELVLLAEHLNESPVTASDIRVWTQQDVKLARVLQHIQQGWPNNGDPKLEPYSSRRLELSCFDGCIVWGTRIVIPLPGREAVLQELHEGHPGITRMKSLARM